MKKRGGADRCIGRSRGGQSTKILAVVDQDALPLRLLLSPGQASDTSPVPEVLAGLFKHTTVIADRGSESNALLDVIARSGAQPGMPSCPRKIRRSINPATYRQRNQIDRVFVRITHLRRVATRFHKLARDLRAAVLLDSTRPWLRVHESRT